MTGRIKILIIGGYGAFGARLVALLKDEPHLKLIIAGRSLSRAKTLCIMEAQAELVPAEFDRDGDVEAQIGWLEPDIVVDASGPFQDYGDDAYRVVRAAFAADADYLDLADGGEFVLGIAELNDVAKAAGKFALSGLSTCPALTCAVVRELAQDLDRVERIAAGIAPSPYAGMGYNVIRAILSYAGKPVSIVRDGKTVDAPGLVDSREYTITLPGSVPLSSRQFSLVDVPDLKVLHEAWPDAEEVWFGAGTQPSILLKLLNIAATMVQRKVLLPLTFFAPIINWVVATVRWGEHRGGMFVEVSGRYGDDQLGRRRWHLIAEGDNGPYIPTMAVAAVIRRCLAGGPPEPGARAASHELSLGDFRPLFEQRNISTMILADVPADRHRPVFWRLLEHRYRHLERPIRILHDVSDHALYRGRGRVERGTSAIAWLVASALRLPKAGQDVAVDVEISVNNGIETWQRSFDEGSFHSTLEYGERRYEGLVVERWGPMAFGMALIEDEGQLHYVLRRWDIFGLPLPAGLAPQVEAYEHGASDRFNFSVRISLPVFGLLAAYRGWLERSD